MESFQVVCPSGQFTVAAQCDANSYCSTGHAEQMPQQPADRHMLLERLQDCNQRAQRLLTLLSIFREQGIAQYIPELQALFADAFCCIQQALQAAAAAKQPLLTTSSQHSSCFCKLLERLHLLDALWQVSKPGSMPAEQQCYNIQDKEVAPEERLQQPSAPFIKRLEAKLMLLGIPGLDAVLAALIAHVQQNAVAGGKLNPSLGVSSASGSKQEVVEVACLSATQEQHSAARALPLLLRLYFNTGSRGETLAAGKPEPLTAKLLERSLAVLTAKPVVPGYADVPVCLTSGLQACQGLTELATARKLKLPTELGKLDFKAAFKLDQSYSLQPKALPVLQQHDELCDLLSQLALEVKQAVTVERDIDPKAFDMAEQLVAGSVGFAYAAKTCLLELDAWRLSTSSAGGDSATPTSARAYPEQQQHDQFEAAGPDTNNMCDRYKLKEEDAVPFMDVLGAVKGLSGLLGDSSSWLQPLLQEHAVKQLNEFAFTTLPALSKLYARNQRVQDLVRAIYACMQGQAVEVGEDIDAPAVALEASAPSDALLQRQPPGPIAEGFEGFKKVRWGKKSAAQAHADEQAAAATAEELIAQAEAAAEADAEAAGAMTAEAAASRVEASAAAAIADVEAAAAAAAAMAAALSAASSPRSPAPADVVLGVPNLDMQQNLSRTLPQVAESSAEQLVPQDGMNTATAAGGEPTAEPPSVPAVTAVEASPVARKRTLKGLFKLRSGGRAKGKAVAAVAQEPAAATPTGPIMQPDVLLPASKTAAAHAAPVSTQEAPADCRSAEAAQESGAAGIEITTQQEAAQWEQQPQQQQGTEQGLPQLQLPSSVLRTQQQQQQQLRVGSESDLLLSQLKPSELSMLPSAASSMTSLNTAGFERPPDLPFELQAAGSDDSPRSVARAAAIFERIAAANRQLAAASTSRLSSAGRSSGSTPGKSNPGAWDLPGASGSFVAHGYDEGGSPKSTELLAMHAAQEQSVSASMKPGSSRQQPSHPVSPMSPQRRKFSFRNLLPHRSEQQQQQQQPPNQCQEQQEEIQQQQQLLQQEEEEQYQQLEEDLQQHQEKEQQQQQQQPHMQLEEHEAVEAEKEQLGHQLDKEQQAAALSQQEIPVSLDSPLPVDAVIPAAWGPEQPPEQPKEGKQRMKGMLSMLRRGNARAASAATTAAVQGRTITAQPEAVQQLRAESADLAVAGPEDASAAAVAVNADVAAAGLGVACSTHGGSQPDASEDFDEDQPAKTRRVMGLMHRIRVFRPQAAKEQQAQQQQQGADATGSRQGLKGLRFTAKLKKAIGDRRSSRLVGADGQAFLALESMPSPACLQLLRVLLELLMHEIKAETKKHLMMQLQMAAAAAAGSAGVAKPDASIARPLKQVKQMIKAVHRMQLIQDFPAQLLNAADLSDLWVGASCGINLSAGLVSVVKQQQHGAAAGSLAEGQTLSSAAKQQLQGSIDVSANEGQLIPPSPKGLHPWSLYNLLFEENSEESSQAPCARSAQASAGNMPPQTEQQPPAESIEQAVPADAPAAAPAHDPAAQTRQQVHSSFPSALMACCMQQLESMPAELPLLALQVFWDARRLLKQCGLLGQGLPLLRKQEEVCVRSYLQELVPTAYEHFKRIAAHQTVTFELLRSCNAPCLLPVKQLYLDGLLREPCNVVLQSDYSADVAAASLHMQPGLLTAQDQHLAASVEEFADLVQDLQQDVASGSMQRAVAELQHEQVVAAEAEQAQEGQASDQQTYQSEDPINVRFSGVFSATKGPAGKVLSTQPASESASPSRPSGRKKRLNRGAKRRSGAGAAAIAAFNAGAGADSKQAAGQTPLMQKLERMESVRETEQAKQQCKMQRCLDAWQASKVDVRQLLLSGMLTALQQEAEAVVARFSASPPTAAVEAQLHAAVLQRTHLLLGQYAPLPASWEQVWEQADTPQQQTCATCGSSSAAAAATGLLRLMDTAVYDNEAQVLLPVESPAATVAVPHLDGVLAEISAAMQPLTGFFGRQHLAALHGLTGPVGMHQLISGLLSKLEEEQDSLLEEVLALQQKLPPSLLQLPPAEQCHTAGDVLQFYEQQLSSALQEPGACSKALGSLQRIGNCLALLHLLSVHQAVQATPAFMQAAPLLGIIGRPISEAAAAAECFECEGLPAPPPAVASAAAQASGCTNLAKACTPGLLMPEVEVLVPSDHARHNYEMQALKELNQEENWRWQAHQQGQSFDETLLKPGGDHARHRVWQASHFQRLMLGPDAEKVRGPGMLLTQTAELRAWRATEGVDISGPCLEKVQQWAARLQQKLQAAQTASSTAAKAGRRGPASKCRSGSKAEVHGAACSSHAAGRRHRVKNQQQKQKKQPESAQPQMHPEEAALLRVQTDAAAGAAAAAAMAAAPGPVLLSNEQSASEVGQLQEQATDGELSEVEQQLQALQAQVNAALIAAEERLRAVSRSPPSGAARAAAAAQVQRSPPEPIPFRLAEHLEEDEEAAALDSVMQGVQQEDSVAEAELRAIAEGCAKALMESAAYTTTVVAAQHSPGIVCGGALLDEGDSVRQASPRMQGPAADSGMAATFLNEHECDAAARAAAEAAAAMLLPAGSGSGDTAADDAEPVDTAAAGATSAPRHSWDAARAAAAQLPDGYVPPAHAKLAYKALMQSAQPQQVATQANASCDSQPQQQGSTRSATHSARAGLAGLVEEMSDVSSSSRTDHFSSRPLSTRGGSTHHSRQQDQQEQQGAPADAALREKGLTKLEIDSDYPRSPSHLQSPRRCFAATCPGRCEGIEHDNGDDAASGSDSDITTGNTPRSPHVWHQHQQTRLGSPHRSPSPGIMHAHCHGMYGPEAASSSNAFFAEAAAVVDGQQQQQQWMAEDEAGLDLSQQHLGPYPSPPITDLLYETTCDELCRVKDERDMLKSEVEVLRNQLRNRDNTLAMLSGQMLITPRTSAADCESLLRAAMSECSGASLALRSQAAVSGVISLASTNVSASISMVGTVAGAAGRTPRGGILAADGVAQEPSGPTSTLPTQQQRQQTEVPAAAGPAGALQSSRQAQLNTAAPASSEPSEIRPENSKFSIRAQQTTPCTTVNDSNGSSTELQSSSDGEATDSISSDVDSADEQDGQDMQVFDDDPTCSAGCWASRKLKMPQTIKSTAARTSSNGSSGRAPAQLAVALSALKFMLLLQVAHGQDQGVQSREELQGGAAASAPAAGASPLKRLKQGFAADAAERTAGFTSAAATADLQQELRTDEAATAAGEQRVAGSQELIHSKGSGRIAGAHYGDGPLLASAVLLHLAGQARRHELLDATSRIAYWVEYDSIRGSSHGSSADSGAAASAAAADSSSYAPSTGALSPRTGAALGSGNLPSRVASIVGAPGGIGSAADGIAPPKPRSKKRQEEEAEALARDRAAAAAQQQLLERLAAAHRQAARVTQHGSSIVARFAPPAPARQHIVRLKVFRADKAAAFEHQLLAGRRGGVASACSSAAVIGVPSSAFVSGSATAGNSNAPSLGGAVPPYTNNTSTSAENPKVAAVPVAQHLLEFVPCVPPWSCIRPTQRVIHSHPSLPMPRPQPLLLPAAGGAGMERGYASAAMAGLPPEAAAAAAAAAAAGTGIVGPNGKLVSGASVAPRAGLVAAARAMAAREVLLQTVPRNAAYSFSVVSDQNRSGRPEDGYSMAPSSADLDSIGPESPRRGRQGFVSAAVGASAARLGGRPCGIDGSSAAMSLAPEQWLAAGSPAGAGNVAGGEASSPTRSPLSRSPTKKSPSAQQSGLLARAVTHVVGL